MPLIFWGSGGFHQTWTEVLFIGLATTSIGAASGTEREKQLFSTVLE